MTSHEDVTLVTSQPALERLVAEASSAETIALDVEGDGLFVYRAKLCTLQLAWVDGSTARIAIIDALGLNLSPLVPLFGAQGPVKVLHDLTFDARLLSESSVTLENVRDTSVAARFLGYVATGLSSLVEREFGIALDKRFQQHDWGLRPLRDEHITYLAGDVRHLLALDALLAARVNEAAIADEVADECAYKIGTAIAPPRDTRPAYVRVKGANALDAIGLAVLRRLVEARERIAERDDVPPFKIFGTEPLLELAKKRPVTPHGVRAIRGLATGRAAGHTNTLARAIEAGIADGTIPSEDRVHFERANVDRALVAAKRAREAQITAWRRREATARGIDEQAVLPGHCAHELADALAAANADVPTIERAIRAIPGLGQARLARYLAAWLAMGAEPTAPREASAVAQASGES
jgi:ribonuclease D